MIVLDVVAVVLGVLAIVYLTIALARPEWF
ncbi:potassium-transporting ATPase subunit F [Raineyella sp.]|nr:potassium-transporting ATPase subunit F [Raineyella sp.]MEA5153728.1 potassium-transporting ATPase subunit F [Raineyella sp.]